MRCYACDCQMSPGSSPDIKTGRYYCDICFEPTNEVMLAAMTADVKKELEGKIEGQIDFFELLDDDDFPEFVSLDELEEEQEHEEDNYFYDDT